VWNCWRPIWTSGEWIYERQGWPALKKDATLKIHTMKLPVAPAPVTVGAPGKLKRAGELPTEKIARPRPVSVEERRRSQRVLLRTRAKIHVALAGKLTTIDAITLSVNPQGALVVMSQSLPVESRLVLEHGHTKERVACKVARAAREMPEGFHVPLEFDSPAPEFWRIAFPPTDWRADDE
jgi:hypothetical protein